MNERDREKWNSTNTVGGSQEDNDFAVCRAMLVVALGRLGLDRIEASWVQINNNYYEGKDLAIETDDRSAIIRIERNVAQVEAAARGSEVGEATSGAGQEDGGAEGNSEET